MIEEILKTGRRTKAELMAATGLTERELTRRIEFERQHGSIILSDSGAAGYYLPNSIDEIRAFVSSMDRRAKRIMLSAGSARRYLKSHGQIAGQMNLDLGGGI